MIDIVSSPTGIRSHATRTGEKTLCGRAIDHNVSGGIYLTCHQCEDRITNREHERLVAFIQLCEKMRED